MSQISEIQESETNDSQINLAQFEPFSEMKNAKTKDNISKLKLN